MVSFTQYYPAENQPSSEYSKSVGDYYGQLQENRIKQYEYDEKYGFDWDELDFLDEAGNVILEAASEITLGLASLVGDREEAQKQIDEMREYLRDKAGFKFGEDNFTITESGKVAADVTSMIAPGLGGLGLALKIAKGAKALNALSPAKQKWAKRAVAGAGFGVGEMVTADVMDPEFVTIGNLIGGPTALNPEDSQATRRFKLLGEGLFFGSALTGIAVGGGKALSPLIKGLQKTPPKTHLGKIDNESIIEKGAVYTAANGTKYEFQGRQWIDLSTGRPMKDQFGEVISFAHRNPQYRQELNDRFLDTLEIPPDKTLTVNVRSLDDGELRVIPGRSTKTSARRRAEEQGLKPVTKDRKTPDKVFEFDRKSGNFRNVDNGKLAEGDDLKYLMNHYGPGQREFLWDGVHYIDKVTGVKIGTGRTSRLLDEQYRPFTRGNPDPPRFTPETKFGDAADASGVPVNVHGVDPIGGPTTIGQRLKDAGREVGEFAGFKAVSVMDNLAKHSRAFATLRSMFENIDEASAHKLGDIKDFWSSLKINSADFMKPIGKAFNDLTMTERVGVAGIPRRLGQMVPGVRTLMPKINKELDDELTRDLSGKLSKDPVVRKASQAIRKSLDLIYERGKAAGLDVAAFRGNYLPRVWDWRGLDTVKGRAWLKEKDPSLKDNVIDDFIERLKANNGVEDLNLMDEVIQANRRPSKDGVVRGRGRPMQHKQLEKMRTMLRDVPEDEVAPYMKGNLYDRLQGYADNAARRIAFADTFGAKEEKLMALMKQGLKEIEAAGGKVSENQIRKIYELSDTLQNRYIPAKHGHGAIRNVSRGLATYQNLRLLDLATLASLAEPFVALQRAGLARGIKYGVPALLDTTIRNTFIRPFFRNVKKSVSEDEAEGIGVALDAGRTSALERQSETFGGMAAGKIGKVNMAFFDAILLAQWTKNTRVMSDAIGKSLIDDNIKWLATKNLSPKRIDRYRRELADLGIDPDNAVDWYKRGANQADEYYQDSIRRGRVRFVDEVIVDPRSTNRPMWHSDPRWAVAANLKGFQTVFGNTIMKKWYRDVMPEFAGGRSLPISERIVKQMNTLATGVIMMTSLYASGLLRDAIKYGEKGNPRKKDWNSYEYLEDIIDRSGFLGAFQLAKDAVDSTRYGASPLATLAGPTFTQAEQLIQRPESAVKRILPLTSHQDIRERLFDSGSSSGSGRPSRKTQRDMKR